MGVQTGRPGFHVEIIPPKQDSLKLEEDLALFASKFGRVMESGFTASLTDNAMGLLAFQGHECIEELGLKAGKGQVLIHLNTFHTKKNLVEILESCRRLGILSLLVVSGDGSVRLPKLRPEDVEAEGVSSVTSVELIRYIRKYYPEFTIGAAFNPYEPREHEQAKLERKLEAGAEFLITQPVTDRNEEVDLVLSRYPGVPLIVEAWMSKKLYLLSDVVGYPIPEDTQFDPVGTLVRLREAYPQCGFYLSLLGFKTQYPVIEEMAGVRRPGEEGTP